MKTKKSIFIIIAIVAVCMSCEKEKTKYEKEYSNNSFFTGFAHINSTFIIHDESISYYNPDSNKVFSHLFEHQNGRKLGRSVHSLKFFRGPGDTYGMITVEGENKIEIVDKNFISVKQIPLYKPRNISPYYEDIILVSYGDAENGGIAVILPKDLRIADTISTGNTAGQIFVSNYIYVLSNGENNTDSTIAKIYYDAGPRSLQKVEDIVIGKQPVAAFPYSEQETGYHNPSLLIQCLGNSVEKPKIVLFDLIRNSIIDSYSYNTDKEYPEHILGFTGYSLFYCSDNKVYSSPLSDLESPELLSEHNLINMVKVESFNGCLARDEQNNCISRGWAVYYVGISGENNEGKQYLYRFNINSMIGEYFGLIDSIPLNDNARKIVSGE